MNEFLTWLVAVSNVQLFEAIWSCDKPETNEQKLEVLETYIAFLQNQYDIMSEEPDKIA